MKALIVGASRGIGFEFVRQYRAEQAQVTATARDASAIAALQALGATAFALDVASAASVAQLAWQIDGAAFDVVVLCAGVYGPKTTALEPPTEAEFDAVMHTNVLGAMQVIAQLGDAFAPGARLAVISSRMGSIGARGSPSGWLYRASKAALNSVLVDAALVLSGKAVCVTLHPGWVRTDMGGAGADLGVAQSVADLRRLIQGLTRKDHGRFLDHDGTPIAW
jgi:NAD(P)-dependent dehydrogenase (short-subunit alcohol dehydrogenase family)